MTAKQKKCGVEVTTLEGLQDAWRPVWDYETDHVRKVMTSEAAMGYRFAVVHITGRVYRLYTNMALSSRLFNRLYIGQRDMTPTPKPQTSISHEGQTHQDGGAIVVCDQSHTPAFVAPQTRKRNRPKTDGQRQVFEAIAGLAHDMGAKKIHQVLLSQGLDVPMSTVKRYMREARR